MNAIRRLSIRLTSVLCLLLILHCGLTTALAKDTWTAVRSKNFNLVGNASEKEIKQVATRLEQFREVFSRLFPAVKLASPVPTTVIVFKSDSSFKPFKPVADGKTVELVAGYFQRGQAVNYIALTAETRSEDTYSTIFHEYVHLLVSNTLGRAGVPPWFNEGLAEYYSTFAVQDSRKVTLGSPIAGHLQQLRSTKLFPLQTLFGIDYYSLERNKHDARGLFYAQSWALVHYLIQGNEGKRLPQLGRFLNLLLKNTALETAFLEAFQIDYVGLEKELKNYVQRSSYRINVATFERKLEFADEMKTSLLTEAEARAYLGDLLFQTHRTAEAIAQLQDALVLDPSLSMAHASLGMALLDQKNFPEAKRHLAKAVQEDPKDYLSHYYYAYVLSREGMSDQEMVSGYTADSAQLLRGELRKAIELRPDFAESYHLLAFVNLVTEENLDEAVKLINKAIALSPGSEEYLFVLAQIYMRKQDFAAARKTIAPLAASASDRRTRETAESLQRSISSLQERMAQYEKEKAERISHKTSAQTAPSADEPASIPTNPYVYLEEALRKPATGEIRVQGLLLRVDCAPKGIVFTIRVADRPLRLATKNFEGVDITTFTTDVRGELTCGPRKVEDTIVVNYRSVKDARAKTDGILTSIDFVPKDFKLSQK